MSEQPKKPRRKTQTKVSLDNKKRWNEIVKDVDKREVPIEILQKITVRLIDGTTITVDVKELIDAGQDPTEIENMLDEKFHDLDKYIENINFFVDLDKVVNTVQPETDKVLKNL